jgi:hypothetical protein
MHLHFLLSKEKGWQAVPKTRGGVHEEASGPAGTQEIAIRTIVTSYHCEVFILGFYCTGHACAPGPVIDAQDTEDSAASALGVLIA